MTAKEIDTLRALLDDYRHDPRPIWLLEEELGAIESAFEDAAPAITITAPSFAFAATDAPMAAPYLTVRCGKQSVETPA